MNRRITGLDVAKVGCLLILIGYCIFALVTMVLRGGKSRSMMQCMDHMLVLRRGLVLYATRHDGLLPDARNWADAVLAEKLIPGEEVLHCPDAPGRYGYAMNSQFSGANYEEIPDPSHQVLLFESTTDERNAHGNLTSVPNPPRHPRGNHYMFVDGHGEWLTKVPPAEGGNVEPPDAAGGENATGGPGHDANG